jgi:large subunit ribosomal protein L15
MNFKRKKNSRQRGTHTHGCGSKKKRRGAGHRGGRGLAGTGKRGDAKKPSYWDQKRRFGKYGFKSKNNPELVAINLSELQNKIETLVSKGLATKNADVYTINLSQIKVEKLLGAGKVYTKLEITANAASESAVKKIEDFGGKVVLPNVQTAE